MRPSKLCISATLSQGQRAILLKLSAPKFDQVYCHHVMWHYNCPPDAPFREGPVKLLLTGIHRGETHEAFVGSLDGAWETPDGRRVHVTLSTAPGTPPVTAGEIDPAKVEPIEPIELLVSLIKRHPTKLRPDRRV